jgi:threonine dehydratase
VTSNPPKIADVAANREALRPWIQQTPVTQVYGLAKGECGELWFKLEAFQVTGSFKVRGALTVMRELDAAQRERGVVTVSAGNHGIAVAYGASHLKCPARVYLSRSVDPYRIQRMRVFGADVQLFEDHASAFVAAESDVANQGRYFVHPFDGPGTTLGTATVALELHEQLPAAVDVFVVAIGGGGLASGLAPTIKALRSGASVIGVEPTGAPTLTRALSAGHPVVLQDQQTIADSLAPPFAAAYSLALVRDHVDEILLVEEDSIRAAMRVLFDTLKLAVEPAAATAFAGVLAHPARFSSRKVCVMICGSNISLGRYSALLNGVTR